MTIMKIATVMVVTMIVWSFVTILFRGGRGFRRRRRPEHFKFSKEALGWLQGTEIPVDSSLHPYHRLWPFDPRPERRGNSGPGLS